MGCGCSQRTADPATAHRAGRTAKAGDWEVLDVKGDRAQVYKGRDAERLALRHSLTLGGTYRQIPADVSVNGENTEPSL